MARKPSLTHTVKVGRRKYALRSNKAFFPEYVRATVQATGPQMRNLAYGSYTLLVDKVLAGDPQGYPLRLRVNQLPYYDADLRGFKDRMALKLQALDDNYLAQKVRERKDPRPLIATAFYLTHIQVYEEETVNGAVYGVYVPDIIHTPSGLPLPTIVGWLEYGTSGNTGMHERPHWRPVALIVRRMWGKLPTGIKIVALKAALRKLR